MKIEDFRDLVVGKFPLGVELEMFWDEDKKEITIKEKDPLDEIFVESHKK